MTFKDFWGQIRGARSGSSSARLMRAKARASIPTAAAAPLTSKPKLCSNAANATSSPVRGSRRRGHDPLHCGHEHRSMRRRGAQFPRTDLPPPPSLLSQHPIARGNGTPDTFIEIHSGRARAPCAKHDGANTARTSSRLALSAAPVSCAASHWRRVRGARTPSAASWAESNRY